MWGFHRGKKRPELLSNREGWFPIIANIDAAWRPVRSDWFSACLDALQSAGDDHEAKSVNNQKLAGDADFAIRAFQLCSAANMIDQHGYVAQNDSLEFVQALMAEVAGAQIDECTVFGQSYAELESGQLYSTFSMDVASAITSGTGLFESVRVSPLIKFLNVFTYIAVAEAFGDTATANELKQKLEQIVKNGA